MSFNEEILELKKRVSDALNKGLVGAKDKGFYETTLVQIVNSAENKRRKCVEQAEQFRRQAAMLDGQAAAFNSVSNIVYGVLNGFVVQAERAEAERLEQETVEQQNHDEAEVLKD